MMTYDYLRLENTWEGAEQSEIRLAHSAQSGNLEAFNALVLKYQDVLYQTALQILGKDALAENATQEAFISAYQNIANFRGGTLKTWFLRILVKKCYDEVRCIHPDSATSWNESMVADCENDILSIGLQNPVPSVMEHIKAPKKYEYTHECLNEMPVNYRAIIALVDFQQISYGEASVILSIPRGTVKSRLARARLYLQRDLKAGEVF